MRINTNIMAINTHRQLGVNNAGQSKVTEKLSSGLRINRAADDAAGLTISEKMRAQMRGLSRASSNAQDGVSLIQAGEGALQETHSILQRMRELAVQAANDVNDVADREAIQSELNQLTSEIDRIAYTTEFNKKTLLDGSLSKENYGSITGGRAAKRIAISNQVNAEANHGDYTVQIAAGKQATATITFGTLSAAAVTSQTDGTYTISDGLGNNFVVDIQMDTLTSAQQTKSAGMVAKQVYSQLSSNSKFAALYDVSVSGTSITITAKNYAETKGFNATIASAGANIGAGAVMSSQAGADGTLTATKGGGAAATGTFSVDSIRGSTATMLNSSMGVTLTVDVAKSSGFAFEVAGGRELTLQVGANTGVQQTLGVAITSLDAYNLGLSDLDVANHLSSQSAVNAIEAAITKVSKQRSELGAIQNRLEHTIANLDTVGENLTSAESRVRDMDMAKGMMEYTKNNILTQAATAMLAQANSAPQTVLQLIQ